MSNIRRPDLPIDALPPRQLLAAAWHERIEPGTVVAAWLVSAAISFAGAVALAAAAGAAGVAATDTAAVVHSVNTDALAIGIPAAATFFGFALGTHFMVRRSGHDRWMNGIATGVLHCAVLLGIVAVALVLQIAGVDLGSLSPTQSTRVVDSVGLFAAAMSGAMALAGSAMGPATIPESGPVPRGAQHKPEPVPENGNGTMPPEPEPVHRSEH